MDYSYKNIFYGLFFSFIVVLIIYLGLKEQSEEELLKSSTQSKAILVKSYRGTARTSAGGDFIYNIKGKEYEFYETGGYYKYLKPGDTVLIEYAVKDHSVARLVDSRFMQKFKKNKK